MSVKPESGGGLLLLRHVTPLTWRNVVYFCSGAYNLLVKIEELVEGPYGPRIEDTSTAKPTRLWKLLRFAERAQAMWPTCSTPLAEGLESEYLSVKEELTEEDREADIESYLEDMRGDQY